MKCCHASEFSYSMHTSRGIFAMQNKLPFYRISKAVYKVKTLPRDFTFSFSPVNIFMNKKKYFALSFHSTWARSKAKKKWENKHLRLQSLLMRISGFLIEIIKEEKFSIGASLMFHLNELNEWWWLFIVFSPLKSLYWVLRKSLSSGKSNCWQWKISLLIHLHTLSRWRHSEWWWWPIDIYFTAPTFFFSLLLNHTRNLQFFYRHNMLLHTTVVFNSFLSWKFSLHIRPTSSHGTFIFRLC